jgi:hypothetical protein
MSFTAQTPRLRREVKLTTLRIIHNGRKGAGRASETGQEGLAADD